MKIALFSDAFLPQVNGIVTHILETVSLFTQKGHQVLIFAPKQKNISQKTIASTEMRLYFLRSIPIFVYENWRITSPFSPFVFESVKKFKPDIIHFHTPFTVGLNGLITAKLVKIPLVATFHGYFMEPDYLRIIGLDKLKLDKSKTINELGWQYTRLFYNRADVVVSPSRYTKTDLISHGINQPIEVISNGVNLSFIKRVKSFLNIEAFRPQDYFLYVGRISKEKSIDILIRAFFNFSKINKTVGLVIVGDGPARKELESLVISCGLKNRVFFSGMINREKLLSSNIFTKALAFITASKSETQGISMLEAMAFGLPLIGVKSRAISELIDGNGILCQSDNIQQISQALHTIANNKKLRIKYTQQSLKIVKKHSIDITVRELESLYMSLIVRKSTKYLSV